MEDQYLDQYWEDVNEMCAPTYDCEDSYEEEDYEEEEEEDYEEESYDHMDGDFDSAMRDAGHGTDEDYGHYGDAA